MWILKFNLRCLLWLSTLFIETRFLNDPRVLRLASKPASLSDPLVSTMSMFIHMDWNPNFNNLQHKHFTDYSIHLPATPKELGMVTHTRNYQHLGGCGMRTTANLRLAWAT